jgi:membrane fusion protein (multidrug efflux system)
VSKRSGRWQGPALFVATALGMAALWGCRALTHAQAGGGWDMPPETVGIVTVEARPWRESATLLATLAPIASVELRTEVGGRLAEVGFTSGASVSRGAVVARLDTSVEEAQLRAVEAELRALTLKRDRIDQVTDGTSRMERDQATADVDAAAARADALRAQIRQKTVIAPFAGRAGVRTLHPGQVVEPGTLLTTLVSASSAIYADAWVPQTLLPKLPAGAKVTVRLGDATAPATVETVEPIADPSRRAVRMRATLDPAPPGWLPEMSAQVEVPTGDEVERPVVPATAIVWSPAGALVYRVTSGEKGDTVTAAAVTVLADLGDEVVLSGGVDAGARIVSDGAFKLHEGSAVKAADPADAKAGDAKAVGAKAADPAGAKAADGNAADSKGGSSDAKPAAAEASGG